ncbi:hypothetical protein ASPACDRAFT_41544 [Aspergillus aculeatus ATCC 16872]|uniref:DUF7703 domain-containing protein n=1 Tax=Aspergillus aculeatus (strain ATCC 16872 / CBS 172.66 / WB 5094) TaxID=690307 RepID=A0A1L9WYI4_ASPA1|nr:uncharacterized protein ASPACDRAFT_41544 [Aspergillus aculeatus ATCC 16872]OJK01280.1 hypothetical protein ASPACDRAFT_41544 [Aspergillus aculeatus ATCC 16872]
MAGTIQLIRTVSLPKTFLLACFVAVAAFGSIELLLLIFDFFKRRRGLYFWSLLLSTLATLVFTVVITLLWFAVPQARFGLAFVIVICYPTLNVGNTLVIYSRLHLVTSGRKIRWLFWMIIISSVVFLLPQAIIVVISASPDGGHVRNLYRTFEKLSVTATCVREMIVGGVFVWATARNLKPLIMIKGREGRKMVFYLIVATTMMVVTDIIIVVVVLCGQLYIISALTAFFSVLKLKLEFFSLGKLIRLIQSAPGVCHHQATEGSSLRFNNSHEVDGLQFNEGSARSTGAQSGQQPSSQETTQTHQEVTVNPNKAPETPSSPGTGDSMATTSRTLSTDPLVHGRQDLEALEPTLSAQQHFTPRTWSNAV